MSPAIATIVGGVYGVEPPRPLDLLVPTPLPEGALGFAVRARAGTHELLVLLPPGVEVCLERGARSDTVALIPPGVQFSLSGVNSACPQLWFELCSTRGTAADLRASRCDLCHEPFEPTTAVRRCAGCGRVLCEDLCSSEGACPRCGKSLGTWGTSP